jgi:hypothetical protein
MNRSHKALEFPRFLGLDERIRILFPIYISFDKQYFLLEVCDRGQQRQTAVAEATLPAAAVLTHFI